MRALLGILVLLRLNLVVGYSSPPALKQRTVTDVIHNSIELHPLCVRIIDVPEFQRLRDVSQLGVSRFVFPGAVHDRFQHSLGVAHLASSWTQHFQRQQPQLGITDADVLCVTLAGLLHDLGHGPLSHFWESAFLPAANAAHSVPEHEELSCAIFDRLLERNEIAVAPWLEPHDLEFIKALIRGGPPLAPESATPAELATHARALRTGSPGVVGSDKSFLYEIVANGRSGFDVDKLDYFSRDCHFAGVVKVSFDRPRLMAMARVARVDEGRRSSDSATSASLQICWPVKCSFEVLQIFQTRFNLHLELYQHRVAAAVGLMLRDALVLADASPATRLRMANGGALRLSECGSARDTDLEGYLQLSDAIVPMVRFAARSEAALGDEALQRAAALLTRLDRRQLYRFAGSVVLEAGQPTPDADQVAEELEVLGAGRLSLNFVRVDVRRLHYGRGARNPMDAIRFFDNKQAAEVNDDATPSLPCARPHPSTIADVAYAARLPGAFEERSLRVFVTEDDMLPTAREVFREWCEQRDACNDECELAQLQDRIEL